MGCCRKIPYRFWIGMMVFFTTFINYTTRSNQPLSITSMVIRKGAAKVPECLKSETTTTPPSNSSNKTDDDDEAKEEYGEKYDWDELVQGYILQAYFWGYFVGSAPSGFVAEWLGPFWTIWSATAISGVFNSVSVPMATFHWGLLIGCRFIIGFVGAFVYPALHVLIARWAPPAEKGKFVAGLMGNALGTCVTWYSVAETTQQVNWYWGYHVVTAQIIVFLIIFWFVCYDYPDHCRWISEEEVEFIKTSQEGRLSKGKVAPPYLAMLRSLPFWAFLMAHFCNLWGLFLQLSGVPKFLKEVVGFQLRKSGLLGALPQLARLIFGLIFGAVADVLLKREIMSKPWIRKSFVLFSHILPGFSLMLIWVTKCDPYAAVGLLTVSLGVNGASAVTHLQNCQDLAPNFAGAIFGLGNLFAGPTGFICPALTSFLIKDHNGINEWGLNFVIGGLVYCFGGLFFIIFGSTKVQPWNEKKEKPAETT